MSLRIIRLALVVLATACSQRAPWRTVPDVPRQQAAGAPTASSTSVAPALATAVSAVSDRPSASVDAMTAAHIGSLFFPVAEMDSTRMDDSFDAPRDGGARRHNSIDIMAPRGAAVLSVQDGRILRLSKNDKGGITIYATDLEEQYVYYYAHLDRYHANVYAGRPLMRGDTLGYVGTTGNAPKNLPHLHFQIMRMPADRKFWSGDPVNPYPLLRQPMQPVSGR